MSPSLTQTSSLAHLSADSFVPPGRARDSVSKQPNRFPSSQACPFRGHCLQHFAHRSRDLAHCLWGQRHPTPPTFLWSQAGVVTAAWSEGNFTSLLLRGSENICYFSADLLGWQSPAFSKKAPGAHWYHCSRNLKDGGGGGGSRSNMAECEALESSEVAPHHI